MENNESNNSTAVGAGAEKDKHSERHRHSHRHGSKPFRKLRHFYKRNKEIFRIIGILLLIVLLAAAAAVLIRYLDNRRNDEENGGRADPTEAAAEAGVKLEPIEGPQCLIGPAVVKLLEEENYSSRAKAMMPYWSSGARIDVCLPVEISFTPVVPTGWTAGSIVVLLSEEPEIMHGREFSVSGSKRSVSVDNLKADTEYYYKVTVLFTNGEKAENTGSFKTADTPRLLNIEGVIDVRDIGNMKTSSGRKIKQGVLYRGMELDGAVQSKYKVTDKGKLDLLSVLGVKTDVDLRSPSVDPGFDVLGYSVEHRFYDIQQYKECFTPYGRATIKQLFADLSDPNIYPVYLHCTAGTDRTGTVCCLLEAILGVEKDEILTDYELTLLARRSVNIEEFSELLDILDTWEGGTLQQKTENFLLDCGVTREQIESIRTIFLG